ERMADGGQTAWACEPVVEAGHPPDVVVRLAVRRHTPVPAHRSRAGIVAGQREVDVPYRRLLSTVAGCHALDLIAQELRGAFDVLIDVERIRHPDASGSPWHQLTQPERTNS